MTTFILRLRQSFSRALMAVGLLACFGQAQAQLQLSPIGTYETGIFDESAAEIAAYHVSTQRLWVTNAEDQSVDLIDISDPTNPVLDFSIDVSAYGSPNSVAVFFNKIAVAVDDDQNPGTVLFYDENGVFQNSVQVGPLPDMLTFTSNGKFLVVANEGEPDDDYLVDPEGSVSVIKTNKKSSKIKQKDVKTATFTAFNAAAPAGVRVFGPGASLSQDMEPEYIAITPDNQFAWVVCQENNTIAKVRLSNHKVVGLYPLGYKDHSMSGNGMDASNRDDAINITTWPAKGLYLPDAIVNYRFQGQDFILSANEGDSRDYDGFSEEERIEDVTLDPVAFPDADFLQQEENLGRLKITTTLGDTDGDGDYDELYSYGARSFSIWNSNGQLVYDSGDDFEQITSALLPDDFNSTNDENDSFDNRSDDKGPEPEGIVLGEINGVTYAFIGLERVGGVMVYDISDPYNPSFVTYVNNRDFDGDAEAGTAGDLGAEGLLFIPSDKSPNGNDLLVVTNEVSGTTTIFDVSTVASPSRLAAEAPQYHLGQNFPNPFLEETTIPLEMPKAAHVSLMIVNQQGQVVANLLDQKMNAGQHQINWNGTNQSGLRLSSGVYYLRFQTADQIQIRKMLINR
ncbi:MAG: choice-of-anchor I family protein [Bacteroidota bacterium]